MFLSFNSAFSNKFRNFRLINVAKYAPDIFSCGSAQIAPCPYDIATKKCRRFEQRVPYSLLYLIVNLCFYFSITHHLMGCLYTEMKLHSSKMQSLLSNNHLLSSTLLLQIFPLFFKSFPMSTRFRRLL